MLTSVISLAVTKEKLKTHTKSKLTEDIFLKKKKSLKTICKCICRFTIIFFFHVRKAEEGRVMGEGEKRERREERKKTEGERDQLIPEWRI